MFVFLQEEGDVLRLPGGSNTEGKYCDEGRGQRTEGDDNGKVFIPERGSKKKNPTKTLLCLFSA